VKYSTFSLEKTLLDNEYSHIAGIDEAGRGCLAGPVVAGVVVISTPKQYLPGVWDSKVMTRKQREEMFNRILEVVDEWAVGRVDPQEIDALGINEAASLAMRRAYEQLGCKPEIVLFDGIKIKTPNVRGFRIKAGDRKHFVISAASVVAKVTRDRLMRDYALEYPEYGFEHHVGYGTKGHVQALEKYGITAIHRLSYSPVALIVKGKNGRCSCE
jgi:ribonuclease HII